MRDGRKAVVAAAAVAVAGLSLSVGYAGNFDNTVLSNVTALQAAQPFDVDMGLGQFITAQNALGTPGALLIDDLTYAVDIDPQDPANRAPLISAGNQQAPWDGAIQRFNRAMGTILRAEMTRTDWLGNVRVFDRISHTVYGQYIARDWSHTGSSIALSEWAVNCSESRHYQTPLMVFMNAQPNPEVITFADGPAFIDATTYQHARVCIKGRVIVDENMIPVRTDFTVEGTAINP